MRGIVARRRDLTRTQRPTEDVTSVSRPRWMTALLLGVTAALLLLPLGLPSTLIWESAQSLSHALLFAALGAFLLRSAQLGLLRTWLLLVMFGAVTEVLQHFTGRQASLIDFAYDLTGASLAVCIQSFLATRSRSAALISTGLTLLALAPFLWSAAAYGERAQQFPVLFQFDSPLNVYFLERSGSRIRRVLPARCGPPHAHSLRVPISTAPFAGILLHEPITDWRAMDTLEIRLANPGPTDLVLTVRVHDRLHDWTYADRYNQEFPLRAGVLQVIHIPVDDLRHGPANGRLMDLSRIGGVAIFRAAAGHATHLCLESVALRTGSSPTTPFLVR
jgi:VanZ family protein